MRYKGPKLGAVLLALVLIVAACTSPAAEPTAIPPTDVPSTDAPTESPTQEAAAADFPTPTVEVFVMPEDSTEAQSQSVVAMPHADAPAAADAYRFDDAAFVGLTGSPQLVEFFTTW